MSQMNVAVLAYAKDAYIEQLKTHMTPLVLDGFIRIFESAKAAESKDPMFNYNYLKRFQTALKLVPTWNQRIILEETEIILEKFDFMKEVLAAIFITYVKILSCIRMNTGQAGNIKVRLPTSDVFVHSIYSRVAAMFYYEPLDFLKYNIQESRARLSTIVQAGIDETIKSLIPVQHILKEYLANLFDENIKSPGPVEPEPEQPFSAQLNTSEIVNGDFGAGTSAAGAETGFSDDSSFASAGSSAGLGLGQSDTGFSEFSGGLQDAGFLSEDTAVGTSGTLGGGDPSAETRDFFSQPGGSLALAPESKPASDFSADFSADFKPDSDFSADFKPDSDFNADFKPEEFSAPNPSGSGGSSEPNGSNGPDPFANLSQDDLFKSNELM